MENKLTISQSPHIHSGETVQKIMYGVLIALIPAFLVGVYIFRFKIIVLTVCSIPVCLGLEYLINRFIIKKRRAFFNGSSIITGVLLAFIVPVNLPLWILAIGALTAIGLGKMAFGGLGKNIFNPALVGYAFLFFVFPSHMNVGESTRFALSDMHSHLSLFQFFFGFESASIGGTSILALFVGFVYLLSRKIISCHIPVVVLATVAVFGGILYLFNSSLLQYNLFAYLLSGNLILGAVFMATDYTTSPLTKKGKVIYGIGIGVITVCISVWGNCGEAILFAILLMNAATPLIDRYAMPKKFG